MKKLLSFFLIVILFCGCGVLAACESEDRPSPNNPVTLTMWHNYGGAMQSAMDSLIDEFNSTVGKDKGITINVVAVSSSSELNSSLDKILSGDPGVTEAPDIFTGYPRIAIKFQEKGLLCNLYDYFTEQELDEYVDEFISEGVFENGLYVFPIAKSTEVLYLNNTLYTEFCDAVGTVYDLSTFEGIVKASVAYYNWTDSQTEELNDGKAFFGADSWFNLAQVGMLQLGENILDNEQLSLDGKYSYILETFLPGLLGGGVALYNGYSSDLSKTGDLICSTGSSAGILFYGDTVSYPNGEVLTVDYNILPYPTFTNGSKIAIQRGGGLIVSKSNAKKEYAASVFIKWLTSSKQNLRFITETGYLPVTKQAFDKDMETHISSSDNLYVQKMLTSVLSMYKEYNFFTAPTFSSFDSITKNYNSGFLTVLTQYRKDYVSGTAVTLKNVLSSLKDYNAK